MSAHPHPPENPPAQEPSPQEDASDASLETTTSPETTITSELKGGETNDIAKKFHEDVEKLLRKYGFKKPETRIELTKKKIEEFKKVDEIQKLQSQLQELRQRYIYEPIAPGVTRSLLGGAAYGSVLAAASFWPSVWAAMKGVNIAMPAYQAGAALHPAWQLVPWGTLLAGGAAGAYVGSKIGAAIGGDNKFSKIVGGTAGAGLGSWGGNALGNFFLRDGFSRLTQAQLTGFSWGSAIPGAIVGSWIGGNIGRIFGHLVSNDPNAGTWGKRVGNVAGAVGGGWVAGAAAPTILGSLLPFATVGALTGSVLYLVGRWEGNIAGRPAASALHTIGRSFMFPYTAGRYLFRKLIGDPLDDTGQGIHNRVMERPSYGFFQKLGSYLPPFAALGPVRTFVRNPVKGVLAGLGLEKDDPHFRDRNSAVYHMTRSVGDAVRKTLGAPVSFGKWLWADRKGGHGGHDDHGHGNGHGH